MAKRRRALLTLSGEQAHQAFALLVDEGKLAVGDVRKALQRRDHLIRDLRAKLAALEAGVVKAGRRVLKNGFFPALLNRVWKRGWREAAEPAQLASVLP